MPNFKEFATEEEYNEAINAALEEKNSSWISERLQKARNAAVKETEEKYKDYEQLKTDSEKWKASEEDYKKQIQDLTGKATASEATALKLRAAAEHKIPLDMAERISGTTAEEIDEDAKNIAQFFVTQTHSAPLRNPESGTVDPVKAKIDKMYSGNPFYRG